jgi:acyl carrier protein
MIKADALREYIDSKLLADKSVKVSNDSLLFKDRILDSMTVLSLIGYIEQKLGRRLKEEEIKLDNFASVHAITKAFHA